MAERKSFLLRIGEPLYREVEAWAQEDFRSVNGQIEFLLREAVQRRKKTDRSAGLTDQSNQPGEE